MHNFGRFIGVIVSLWVGLAWPLVSHAQLQSENYQLQDYSVGASTTDPSTGSTNFQLFAESGASTGGEAVGPNFQIMSGLAFANQADIPQTPTLENPVEYYDRLKFTLNPGSDPADTKYAIAISRDDFATTQFISADLTVVDELAAEDWQVYADWGGAQGEVVTGLLSGSDYAIKVKAIQGEFTESNYSLPAEASTVWPSLTFSVDGDAEMGIWREENNYSSTSVSTLTTSTNAYNGYKIYAFATQPLTRQNGSEIISNISATYANPISWTVGTGFGYTTNDTSVGGSQQWNQDPCPGDSGQPLCYAPFSQTAPGDVVADHESELGESTIIDEEFLLTYKVVTEPTQTAGTYSTTIVYTVVPTY